jgi:hypothetical protein
MSVRMIDIETALDDTLKEWGSDQAQRADAVMLLKSQCQMVGDLVVFRPTKTAINEPQVREWLEANKPHMLPRKYEESLADQAFLGRGNATKVQELFKQVGSMSQLDEIARRYGRKSALDSKSIGRAPEDNKGDGSQRKPDPRRNAWADESPNGEARRIAAISSLGTRVCAQLAAAAGKTISGAPLKVT